MSFAAELRYNFPVVLRYISILRLLCTSVVLALAVTLVPLNVRADSELEQHLRGQYKGKTLLLRNFYAGSSLHYDASGELSRKATPGDWTVDAVIRVEDVKVSNHRLTVDAKRQHMGWPHNAGFSGKDATGLRVEAELDPAGMTADKLDLLFSRIFLTPRDHFAELVPDYWKPCVLAALGGKVSKQYVECHFSPEFLAIPGVVSPLEPQPAEQVVPDASGEVLQAGKGGVTPPKIRSTQNPEFSPEARAAKYQGTVTLLFVVSKMGDVRDVRIMSPLGFGLDRKAVEAVAKWRFDPGKKNGDPVDVELAAQTDFHLY